jgi:hypothetical protein
MDEGTGTGEGGPEGWAALRLCNLVAQSSRSAERGLQAGSGEGTDGEGNGAVGADLLQGLQEPDPSDRAGNRDAGPDAGHGQIARLLPEMICADFLADAHLDNGDPEILLNSISRYYKFLPGEQQQAFLAQAHQKAS